VRNFRENALDEPSKPMIARVATSRGYGLIEMVIVIAIIALIAVVAIPNFIAWNQMHQLKSDVSNLAQMLSIARMTAINQNINVNVIVCHQLPVCPGTAPNPITRQVTVFFLNPNGPAAAVPPGFPGAPVLPSITMNTAASLSNVAGAQVGAAGAQIVSFLPTGMWTNSGAGANICLASAAPFAPGACANGATAQVLNFRDPGVDNYRIVIRPTGKVTWCYVGSCVS
jgi:prepilin-type N-terminal cleavage/methylation domain-containing protein